MPDTAVFAPVADTRLFDLLETRRSVPPVSLVEPVPRGEELQRLLTVASRVPDHGRMVPWRFLLFEGASRERAGERLAALYVTKDPEAPEAMRRKIATALSRAPLVVAVVDRSAPSPKIPEWEQHLCVGAVCMTLVVAANAMGYGANWLTGWAAADADARAVLGLGPEERIAGFIHIGTPTERPAERPRPDVDTLVTRWSA
ncbi:MAG: nitroreductase [Alphaproteobacteria bacterium]